MSKTFASLIAVAAVTAVVLPAHAGLSENGLALNGLQENGLALNGLEENGTGVMMRNGQLAPNSISTDIGALQAVRLVMPDGTEWVFR
jgi:hypothetical protein